MMRKLRLIRSLVALTVILGCSLGQVAQNTPNNQYLLDFSKEKQAAFMLGKAQAVEFAGKHNIPVIISSENIYSELMSVSSTGVPQYYTITNKNSAGTISTGKLQAGELPGIHATGRGIMIYQWDAGAARPDHQEFSGRIFPGDNAAVSFHATHTAGTMISAGKDPRAKGMAPEATVKSFEWNNVLAEMAEAASEGALLGNHSYGMVRGWATDGNNWFWFGDTTVSKQEDYLFGFYDEQAHDWDVIAHEAPGFLIVKSAGNDRNEGPSGGVHPKDGPWDCISNAALAKNVLTVGAVDAIPGGYSRPSDVEMSSFSSWGPSDDGRIKPDIVADGVGLYSSGSSSGISYLTLCGTSMATASVTGSLALLQQIWNDQYGSYMLAATLKALVIATADETGPALGPDYMYGWGLMNTMKAAECIEMNKTGNTIREENLQEGSTIEHLFTSDGQHAFRVVLSWTDVPGTPVAPALDPEERMLVNDLDLEITRDGNTWYPWSLDPGNPSSPATHTGPNSVDNVEVVLVANPVPGDYTLRINHQGTLEGGSQPFSLVIYELPLGDPASGTNFAQGIEGSSPVTPELRVYPNPSREYIRISLPTAEDTRVSVLDNLGREVLKGIITGGEQEMDVTRLMPGSYILVAEQEGHRMTGKLLKQ